MALVALASAAGCDVHGIVGANASDAIAGSGGGSGGGVGSTGAATAGHDDGDGTKGDGDGDGDGGVDTTPPDLLYDVGPGDGPTACLAPPSPSCDDVSEEPWHALGVGCNSLNFLETEYNGHPGALYVHEGMLGTYGEYTPREGERMVILSTGLATDIPRAPLSLNCGSQMCPSTALEPGIARMTLPPPIDTKRVDDKDTCTDDPDLVGLGDCSNTLESQWAQGAAVAYDYAELRMTAKVPDSADAFVYEFAFFSAEYPPRVDQDSAGNDMFVAWLESEAWTGNISFDEHGNPISTNGVFLDYLDADSPSCVGCVAPQLDGFAMDGHAGTRWLETVAPVRPGEVIEVIFAIFDLNDAQVDTAVLLDGVHWGCTDLPPLTAPTP